jgi:hydroxymethylbilane synthase
MGATDHLLPQNMLRLGTRGSPLALAQAEWVRALLGERLGLLVELRIFTTSGDHILDRPLAEVGGKGLFTKELEEQLLSSEIDLAVHSMKDMETHLPAPLTIAAVLPREDPHDRLVGAKKLADLPVNARVGTSSLRRAAQLNAYRSDLQIVPFRGNVDTRLAKLGRGEADATILAAAGLNRLGRADLGTPIPIEHMLPAAAQGAVAVEMTQSHPLRTAVRAALNDPQTETCVTAERAVLAALDGSCRTAIAAYAQITGADLILTGEYLSPDGRVRRRLMDRAGVQDAFALGSNLGARLRV